MVAQRNAIMGTMKTHSRVEGKRFFYKLGGRSVASAMALSKMFVIYFTTSASGEANNDPVFILES